MSKVIKQEKNVKISLDEPLPLQCDSVSGDVTTSESDSSTDIIEKPKKIETRGRKKIPEELKKKSPKVDGRTGKVFVMTEARKAVFEKGQAILRAKNEAKRKAKEEEKKKYDEWKNHLQEKRNVREERRQKREIEAINKDLDESSDEEIIVKKKPKKKKVVYISDSDSDDNRKKNVIIINNGNATDVKKPVPVPRPVPTGVFC